MAADGNFRETSLFLMNLLIAFFVKSSSIWLITRALVNNGSGSSITRFLIARLLGSSFTALVKFDFIGVKRPFF